MTDCPGSSFQKVTIVPPVGRLGEPEAMLHFRVQVIGPVPGVDRRLGCNFPGEVYKDGPGGPEFFGYVGDRCRPGETVYRAFEGLGPKFLVRVRYIRTTPVTCTRVDGVPFVIVDLPAASFRVTVVEESGWKAGAPSALKEENSKLPRQQWVFNPRAFCVAVSKDLVPVRVEACDTVPRAAIGEMPLFFPVDVQFVARHAPSTIDPRTSRAIADELGSGSPSAFATNLMQWFLGAWEARQVIVFVWDLGVIGSHRLLVTTFDKPCILVWSEVSDPEAIQRSANRSKTGSAMYIGADCACRAFGLHGCRYVMIVQDAHKGMAGPERPPVVAAWRCEYPVHWKVPLAHAGRVPGAQAVLCAARRNLLATIDFDGTVMDTCWRERTGWTGDMYMAMLALLSLTTNKELLTLAVENIMGTYDKSVGMVQAIAPVPAHIRLFIPLYHLLFCLMVGTCPKDALPEGAMDMVAHSMRVWRSKYVDEALGLVRVAGEHVWNFVDWSKGVAAWDSKARGDLDPMAVNSVVNAFYCRVNKMHGGFLGGDTGVRPEAFQAAFHCSEFPGAYGIVPGDHACASVHGTASAILGGVCLDRAESGEALKVMSTQHWGSGCKIRVSSPDHAGPTAFFAGFVCAALFECRDTMVGSTAAAEYAVQFYGDFAKTLGSLPEKKDMHASLAHSWSVGAVPFLL